MQHFYDWDFAKCTAKTPAAVTCTDAWGDVDNACNELERTMRIDGPGQDCKAPYSHPANTQAFAHPSTIVLGKTIWDLFVQ